MKLFNREKRIEYLGFNDRWFMIIGIIVLSFVTDFLFSNNSFGRLPFLEALINWSVSLLFSTTNWFIMRSILIGLRKRYPSFSDDFKRIPLFFLGIVGTVLFVDRIGDLFLGWVFGGTYNHPPRLKIILPIILISTMTMAIYEAIYYYTRLKKSIREEEQAKQAIVQAQLDTLRNQAQPHFFFNSLNTLRDIIDQNTKGEAKEFVNRLAEVYRFILDSGNVNLIALRDELKFARAYIHIQKERFGDNLSVTWEIAETAMEKMVVPMSLQLLLENAVKHNVVSRANPLTIRVTAEADQLVVFNRIQPKTSKLPSTKLGLKNIKRRYALISETPMYVINEKDEFSVSLPLLQPVDQKKHYAGIDH